MAATRKSPIEAIEPEAHLLLVGERQEIYGQLRHLALKHAAQMGVPLQKVRVFVKQDPEENWKELVFQFCVTASPEKALAFWDNLGHSVQQWQHTLPQSTRRILEEQVAIYVEWS